MKRKGKTQNAVCTIPEELIFCGTVGNYGGGETCLILKATHSPQDTYMMIM